MFTSLRTLLFALFSATLIFGVEIGPFQTQWFSSRLALNLTSFGVPFTIDYPQAIQDADQETFVSTSLLLSRTDTTPLTASRDFGVTFITDSVLIEGIEVMLIVAVNDTNTSTCITGLTGREFHG